jgi:hypothetical protein
MSGAGQGTKPQVTAEVVMRVGEVEGSNARNRCADMISPFGIVWIWKARGGYTTKIVNLMHFLKEF